MKSSILFLTVTIILSALIGSTIADEVYEVPTGIDALIQDTNLKLTCKEYKDCYNCTVSNCNWDSATSACVFSRISAVGETETIQETEDQKNSVFNDNTQDKSVSVLEEISVKRFFGRAEACKDTR
jgi:hypothetical protein